MFLSRKILTLTASMAIFSAIHAKDSNLDFSIRLGGKRSHQQVHYEKAQSIPGVEKGDGIDLPQVGCPTPNDADFQVNLNPAFFPLSTTDPKMPAKNNDTLLYHEIEFGVRASYLSNDIRPSKSFAIGPTGSIYGLFEGSSANALGTLYSVKPGISGGADIGIIAANNGNSFQIGGGGLLYKATYQTGDLFGRLESTNEDNTLVDYPTQFDAQTAETKYTFQPYIYTEISTEIGDILTVFLKGSYGFPVNAQFSELPSDNDSQMFAGNAKDYIDNMRWQTHSFSIGVSSRIDDLY